MSLERELLSALAPWRDAPRWFVAFSGGLDSSVLLHLLSHLRQTQDLPPLVAVHVDHGLQAAAGDWVRHCRSRCGELVVPLEVRRVEVESGASLERAARQARYAAFEALLEPEDVLLCAHHRDDQAETLLFRLLRGSGVRGLGAMAPARRLGRGWLVRPWLSVSREVLEGYAQQFGLTWVEDPSNRQVNFARNYLRHEVFPVLERRWPQAKRVIGRAAAHLAEADALLGELAENDLRNAAGQGLPGWLPLPSLDLAALGRLSPARQRNALRHWLRAWTLLPDSEHWAGWRNLLDASEDACPIWRLTGGELRRANGRVWWLSGQWLAPLPAEALAIRAPETPLPNNGELTLTIGGKAPSGVELGALTLRYRQGGELMHAGSRGRRDLKRLLNEADVPWFVRQRLPLVYRDGELLAVANLPGLCPPGWEVRWLPPAVTAV